MIHSLADLPNYQVIVVLYYSGSSGEFFSQLLSSCLADVSSTAAVWENESRCKILDFYDRSLNSGLAAIDADQVVTGVNQYLSNLMSTKKYHVGLAHPRPSTIKFLKTHATHCPIIEIVCNTKKSLDFRHAANIKKIAGLEAPYIRPAHTLKAEKHLCIEWSDLFLDAPEETFTQITKFLNTTGDVDKFLSQIEDYLTRNKDILETIS